MRIDKLLGAPYAPNENMTTWKLHNTEEEKKRRRIVYKLLRHVGIQSRNAVCAREWSNKRIKEICMGVRPCYNKFGKIKMSEEEFDKIMGITK